MENPCGFADALGLDPDDRYFLPPRVAVSYPTPCSLTILNLLRRSRHLLGTGRETEARAVIAELNGVPLDDELVEEHLEELEYGIKAENEGGKATWAECFSERNLLWKRTLNGMMLQFIQQLNGQNFYCTSFSDGMALRKRQYSERLL